MRLLVPAGPAGEFPSADVLVVRPGEADDTPVPVHHRGDTSPFHGRVQGPGRYVAVARGDRPTGFAAEVERGLDGIVLHGWASLADIEQAGARLAVVEAETGREDGALRVLAVVDRAAAALSLPAFRPLRRLAGIAVDPEGLAAALGCGLGAPPVTQAIDMTVLAARACGVEPVLVASSAAVDAVARAERDGFAAILLR